MYSALQNAMLCVNCFRDLPNEIRAQCVDIETAHSQASKRLERGQTAIMDLQVYQLNLFKKEILHYVLLRLQ